MHSGETGSIGSLYRRVTQYEERVLHPLPLGNWTEELRQKEGEEEEESQ